VTDITTPSVHYHTTEAPRYEYSSGGIGLDASVIRQIADAVASLTTTTQAQNFAAIQATNSAAQSAQEIATETRSDVNRISGDIRLSQSESESRLGSAVERNGGDTRTSVERNGGDTRAQNAQNTSDLRRDISDSQVVLHGTIEDRATEIRGTLAANNTVALLEMERGKFTTLTAKCDIERQAAENLGRLQLEAERNKFDLSKQMAAGFCDMKTAVHGDGEATRNLIQKTEIDRLREALECSRREHDRGQSDNSTRIHIENTLRNWQPAQAA
jgi:hypothetical protein